MVVLTPWNKQLNWKHENPKWEDRGCTSRWKKREADTERQLFHQCSSWIMPPPSPHPCTIFYFSHSRFSWWKKYVLHQNICGNNGCTLLGHLLWLTGSDTQQRLKLRQIPTCGRSPWLMSLRWLGHDGGLGGFFVIKLCSKREPTISKDYLQNEQFSPFS